MTNSRSGILFDVDGTLCDTNYLHTVAWSRALADVGEYVPAYVIHHHIGMGSDLFTKELIGRHSEDAVEAHSKYFAEMYGEIKALPGATQLLRTVSTLGARVVLASSAGPDTFDVLREVLDVEDVLDASTNSGDVDASKPAPDIFEAALAKAELSKDQAIVVGDSVWDVKSAKKAGLECVCVLTGGVPEALLREAGAIAVYKDPLDLVDNILTSPIAKYLNPPSES